MEFPVFSGIWHGGINQPPGGSVTASVGSPDPLNWGPTQGAVQIVYSEPVKRHLLTSYQARAIAALFMKLADEADERAPTSKSQTEAIPGDRQSKTEGLSMSHAEPSTESLQVHILHEGRTLCKMSDQYGTPNMWPTGHVWVGRSDSGQATCHRCIECVFLRALEAEIARAKAE